MFDFSSLESFLNHITKDIGIPSADVIVHHNGDEIFRYATGKSYSPDLPLHFMYSVTKPVTVVAGLQLLERGLFLLDTPLYEIFPEFKNMAVKKQFNSENEGNLVAQGRRNEVTYIDEGETIPAENPILIRHLFSMTAGFDYNRTAPEIQKYTAETEGRFPTRYIAKALSERPLQFEPGTHWRYSFCHDVLAAVIEEVSGMKFSQYVSKNIFEPLGMNDSGFSFTQKEADRTTPQYRYDYDNRQANLIEKSKRFMGTEYESGGGGLISSADDMIKFACALSLGGTAKNGARILSRAGIELLRSNQLSQEILPDLNWEQLRGYGYGLGVRTMIDPAAGGSLSPVGEFGWGGAAGSYLMADTKNRIAVFYAQHMLNNLEPYVHPRIRNIVYSCINP